MLELYRKGNPTVTVIMATYNRATYLHRSISSYLDQTFADSELIVVDDGSTDNTFEVVRGYMDRHKNIRYMRHTNRKLSLSKNVGIKAAAGDLIAFLDSDDAYKPDYLERRVEYLERHPEVDLLEGGVIIIGDPYVKDRFDAKHKIHLSQCHIGATFFGKKEVFYNLGGFNKNVLYAEDSVFWKQANEKYVIHRIESPGYVYYRDTEGSICNTV